MATLFYCSGHSSFPGALLPALTSPLCSPIVLITLPHNRLHLASTSISSPILANRLRKKMKLPQPSLTLPAATPCSNASRSPYLHLPHHSSSMSVSVAISPVLSSHYAGKLPKVSCFPPEASSPISLYLRLPRHHHHSAPRSSSQMASASSAIR